MQHRSQWKHRWNVELQKGKAHRTCSLMAMTVAYDLRNLSLCLIPPWKPFLKLDLCLVILGGKCSYQPFLSTTRQGVWAPFKYLHPLKFDRNPENSWFTLLTSLKNLKNKSTQSISSTYSATCFFSAPGSAACGHWIRLEVQKDAYLSLEIMVSSYELMNWSRHHKTSIFLIHFVYPFCASHPANWRYLCESTHDLLSGPFSSSRLCLGVLRCVCKAYARTQATDPGRSKDLEGFCSGTKQFNPN